MDAKFEKLVSQFGSLYLMVVDLNPHNTIMHLFLGEQIYRLPSFFLFGEMKEHEGHKTFNWNYGIWYAQGSNS